MKGKVGSVSTGVEEDGSCKKIVIRRIKSPINVVNPKISDIKVL